MTAPEQPQPSPEQLLALLDRFAEVLPREPLQLLQQASAAGKLTDELVMQHLSAQGQALIGLGVATSTNTALLRGLPETHLTRLSELGEHVKTHAPVLLQYPRIQGVASQIADSLDQSVKEGDLPFDDLSAIQATPTYFSDDDRLVPTVRLAISFSNRDAFPPVSLLLTDVAYLAAALIATLTRAAKSTAQVARSGLLDESELDDIREALGELGAEWDEFKSNLPAEVLSKSDASTAAE